MDYFTYAIYNDHLTYKQNEMDQSDNLMRSYVSPSLVPRPSPPRGEGGGVRG